MSWINAVDVDGTLAETTSHASNIQRFRLITLQGFIVQVIIPMCVLLLHILLFLSKYISKCSKWENKYACGPFFLGKMG